MQPSPEMIPVLIDTAKTLKGSQRRLFMAKTVAAMGRGGQLWAEAHLGWNRGTIRKGMHELRSGMTCVDAFHCRRRKPAEAHLPRLLEDIRSIADGQSQVDPKFQTNRLFTRISAAEVRRQLIATKGYTDAELPTPQTINKKLNMLGFCLTKVAKSRPQKKSSRPTPSSSNSRRSTPRPIGPTTPCGSRSTPRPQSISARSHAGARAAPRPRRRTMTSSPKRR